MAQPSPLHPPLALSLRHLPPPPPPPTSTTHHFRDRYITHCTYYYLRPNSPMSLSTNYHPLIKQALTPFSIPFMALLLICRARSGPPSQHLPTSATRRTMTDTPLTRNPLHSPQFLIVWRWSCRGLHKKKKSPPQPHSSPTRHPSYSRSWRSVPPTGLHVLPSENESSSLGHRK